MYIEKDIDNPGLNFDLLGAKQYRAMAKHFEPWSSLRFNALVDLASSRKGAQLVVCVEPCMGRKLYYLCVILPVGPNRRLLSGMAQMN